jgi:hypothetical protein
MLKRDHNGRAPSTLPELIHEGPHDAEHPYTRVSNALIFDRNISAETFRTLVRLLSKPKHWRIHRPTVIKEFGLSDRDARRAFGEATQSGYLHGRRLRRPDGKLGPMHYELFERPVKEILVKRASTPRVRNVRVVRDTMAQELPLDGVQETHVESMSAPRVQNPHGGECTHIEKNHHQETTIQKDEGYQLGKTKGDTYTRGGGVDDDEDEDEDEDLQALGSKIGLDATALRKLQALKGDQALTILRLALKKDNPGGYVAVCIRNAERDAEVERRRDITQVEPSGYKPGEKVTIFLDGEEQTFWCDEAGRLPFHVRAVLPKSRKRDDEHDANERARKVRQRLYSEHEERMRQRQDEDDPLKDLPF